MESVRIARSKNIATIALSGKAGRDKILARLIDTPTKINPVKAAEAPTAAM